MEYPDIDEEDEDGRDDEENVREYDSPAGRTFELDKLNARLEALGGQ